MLFTDDCYMHVFADGYEVYFLGLLIIAKYR